MQVTFDPLKDVNNRVKVRFYFTGILQNGVTCIWPDKMLLWDINSVNSVAVDLPTVRVFYHFGSKILQGW